MNIYLKFFFFIILSSLSFGYSWASESSLFSSDTIKLCKDAEYGTLNLNKDQKMKPLEYSYLINCAISEVVSLPDEKSTSVENRNAKKRKIADFLLSQNFDVNYRDESGSTLVISVILSYMSSEWKIKNVEKLISKGCDINKKNKYGKSAVDLAKFKEESEIIKILLRHLDK
jgi:ankyrin repeat protein